LCVNHAPPHLQDGDMALPLSHLSQLIKYMDVL
jgi:hypothetical protein